MDTIETVSFSRSKGLTLTSTQGRKVTINTNIALWMLVYSPKTPSTMPSLEAPWSDVVAACSEWSRQRIQDGAANS